MAKKKNGFFKMIGDLLFDEVVVEENAVIDEEDEYDLPPVKSTVVVEKKQPILKEEKGEEPIKKEILNKETRSTMINVDEVKLSTPAKKAVSQGQLEKKTKIEYEFTKVISPIYGVMNESEETVEFVSTPKKKQTVNNSRLGTIISPIYGLANSDASAEMNYSFNEEVKEEQYSIDDLIEKRIETPLEEVEEEIVEENPIHHEANFDSLVKTLEEESESIQEGSDKKVVESQNLSLFDDFEGK